MSVNFFKIKNFNAQKLFKFDVAMWREQKVFDKIQIQSSQSETKVCSELILNANKVT